METISTCNDLQTFVHCPPQLMSNSSMNTITFEFWIIDYLTLDKHFLFEKKIPLQTYTHTKRGLVGSGRANTHEVSVSRLSWRPFKQHR